MGLSRGKEIQSAFFIFFLSSTATQGFFPTLCCGDWYKHHWAQPLCEEGELSSASHIRIQLESCTLLS